MPIKKSSDTIGNRTRNLTVYSAVPQPLRHIGETSFANLMISISIFDLHRWPLHRPIMSLLDSFELSFTNNARCPILCSKGRDCNPDWKVVTTHRRLWLSYFGPLNKNQCFIFLPSYTHTHPHTYTYIHSHTSTHTHPHTHIHTHTHTSTHTNTFTHTHTFTHAVFYVRTK
jgi:hypothetical protein